MRKTLLLTTMLAASFMISDAAFAQQQGAGTQQGGQAQGGLPGQRLAQEQAAQQGTELWISPAGVRQVKQALNQQGYDPGSVDGQWNQEAQTAARNFQQAQGLEPTGQLNVQTLAALGMTNILSGRVDQNATGLPGQQLGQEAAAEGGTQLYISPAGVRQIQQALNQRGYDVGNVDGAWNQGTQQAARNFQQAQGLEPSGNLDIALIDALGMQNLLSASGQAAQGGQAQGGLPGQQLGQEQAQQSGAPLFASPAQVRQIKQALNQAGYDVGNVNAAWDQNVQDAVRNYQQAQGLEPTGNLTLATLAALGMIGDVMGQGVAQGGQGVQGGQAGTTGATGGQTDVGGQAGATGGQTAPGGQTGATGQQSQQSGTTGGQADMIQQGTAGATGQATEGAAAGQDAGAGQQPMTEEQAEGEADVKVYTVEPKVITK